MDELFICKIASPQEMKIKWEYEIAQSGTDKENWIVWNKQSIAAFRTLNKFQGKGYFSKLFHFMIEDLRQKGFTKATLGVEPAEEKNKEIYAHYGFTEYIKSGKEYYPDGTVIDVEYYGRTIE